MPETELKIKCTKKCYFFNFAGENVLDYDQFKQVRNLCGEKCLPYLSPKTFAKLQHGDPVRKVSEKKILLKEIGISI